MFLLPKQETYILVISTIDLLKSPSGSSDFFTIVKLSYTFHSTMHGISFFSIDSLVGAGEAEFPSAAARFDDRDDLLLWRMGFLGFAACDFSPIGCRSEEDRGDEEANSPPPPSVLWKKSSSSATRSRTSPSPMLKSSSSTSKISSTSQLPPSSPLKSLQGIVSYSKMSSCTLKLLVQMLSFASFLFLLNSNV